MIDYIKLEHKIHSQQTLMTFLAFRRSKLGLINTFNLM